MNRVLRYSIYFALMYREVSDDALGVQSTQFVELSSAKYIEYLKTEGYFILETAERHSAFLSFPNVSPWCHDPYNLGVAPLCCAIDSCEIQLKGQNTASWRPTTKWPSQFIIEWITGEKVTPRYKRKSASSQRLFRSTVMAGAHQLSTRFL